MFFGSLTIAINGFSMFFLFCYHRFQWFAMISDHWSNDAMVSMDRCGLVWGAKLDFFDQLIKSMGTYLCPECGKNILVDADLYLHQVTAHNLNSYACENCGETTVGKKTLDNHMRKHNTAVTRLKTNHKCEE